MISTDPYILLSIINTRLRDLYSSLDALCDDLDEDKAQIEETLKKIDYTYDCKLNRFVMGDE